ncbi:IS66 family insertion sequence element accessory protein TnpB [Mesobacterium pallidum]|uniref:IS66 family insertion sequence element accessory protein TnpB n=1 Tax=Mesobacterium pallidum TaxID=2872037 RepID=UPI001EE1BA67|nr:IS66 family insertion sequence element accessory protein TnpB [Mesobacterium pallidum]
MAAAPAFAYAVTEPRVDARLRVEVRFARDARTACRGSFGVETIAPAAETTDCRDRACARGVNEMMPSPAVRIPLATQPVDIRKGQDGRALMVQSVQKEDPFTGTLVRVGARRTDRPKILFPNGRGPLVACKWRKGKTFTSPAVPTGVMGSNPAQC